MKYPDSEGRSGRGGHWRANSESAGRIGEPADSAERVRPEPLLCVEAVHLVSDGGTLAIAKADDAALRP
jgi:hypothetical protein